MKRKILALVVRAELDEVILGRYTTDEWRGEIDGYLEGVSPNTPGSPAWFAYCDEEGKLKGLPPNLLATALARAAGWRTPDFLCGPVVFFGPPDHDGNETDVTQEFLACGTDLFVGGVPNVEEL